MCVWVVEVTGGHGNLFPEAIKQERWSHDHSSVWLGQQKKCLIANIQETEIWEDHQETPELLLLLWWWCIRPFCVIMHWWWFILMVLLLYVKRHLISYCYTIHHQLCTNVALTSFFCVCVSRSKSCPNAARSWNRSRGEPLALTESR